MSNMIVANWKSTGNAKIDLLGEIARLEKDWQAQRQEARAAQIKMDELAKKISTLNSLLDELEDLL